MKQPRFGGSYRREKDGSLTPLSGKPDAPIAAAADRPTPLPSPPESAPVTFAPKPADAAPAKEEAPPTPPKPETHAPARRPPREKKKQAHKHKAEK
jgi:hypothetical protein